MPVTCCDAGRALTLLLLPLPWRARAAQMVESVKWVDEVITDVPYDLTPAFLERLIHEHHIDYVIHGDDPCLLPDGTDAYEYAKKSGRFRMVSRRCSRGRMARCNRWRRAAWLAALSR
jgi:glycerol-3-phosphate cytidylyltransferase-like family protein